MAEVIWRRTALDDLDAIESYIRPFDDVAARRTARRLIDCGESLAIFPNRGRPGRPGEREMTTVPPFVLSYEVVGKQVFILHIRHGAQLPREDEA